MHFSFLKTFANSMSNNYRCCGSNLFLVEFKFPFVFAMVMYQNEFKTKQNKV